jgi:hypothetical protein
MEVINLGSYCNDKEAFFFMPEVFESRWLRHAESGEYAFVPTQNQGFEIMGSSIDEDMLNALPDDELNDDALMQEKGWDVLSITGRLFSPTLGAILLSKDDIETIKTAVTERFKESDLGLLIDVVIDPEEHTVAAYFEKMSNVDAGWVDDYLTMPE